MTIGDRVRAAREARGLTQKDLAQKVGIAQPTISDLETGTHQSSVHLVRLAIALRVRPEWIETGRGAREWDDSLNERISIINQSLPSLNQKQLEHIINQIELFLE